MNICLFTNRVCVIVPHSQSLKQTTHRSSAGGMVHTYSWVQDNRRSVQYESATGMAPRSSDRPQQHTVG